MVTSIGCVRIMLGLPAGRRPSLIGGSGGLVVGREPGQSATREVCEPGVIS